ncbi:MAG TPA: hypothetical protein VFZ09_28165 [Archangium sp.]|uniref:hypothetical protein n=1 Tax=Archangium sp. TaxID=1872627 RepID=UPI002E310F16|nr:hypothetical protein [Archangium sp.]HEX5750138.1 hypothetical protein [Archangium sp.]
MNESSSRPGLERTLRALASAARPHPSESEEYAVIALAARALLFLHSRDELEDFYGWLESREAGVSSGPVRTFPSMDEALGWLEHQPEAAQGSLVEVERETYVIALGPTGSFVLVRTVTHHEPVGV